ncbi:sugar phosphate isomerase/epimerase family protein [Tolumonas lignilytica]|uniref:sugar phosphate isomerase/epimerase family protein n=1 Tax=Tolumonas lignilytica TaxID=1283284 RepID=UPI000466CF24|nr:TIM barrel protein [Tolumonas lignilytica]
MSKKIVVVTSAYGADMVRRLGGQRALLPLIEASGADGVEIRHELISAEDDADELASDITKRGLFCVYSVPEPLLNDDGQPELDRLAVHMKNAERMKARTLKLPLGSITNATDLTSVIPKLQSSQVRLVIENDQTQEGGRISPMVTFFGMVLSQHVPVSMTFDMANWNWQGEDAFIAARALASQVAYIHVKASHVVQGKINAVALDNSDGSWKDLLAMLPTDVPRGIEFPLQGDDLTAVTRYYVAKLKEV